MKNQEIRNKVRIKKNGDFSMNGLSESAKANLFFIRKEVPSDEYITAMYDEESNDVFFVTNDKYSQSESKVELIYS